MVIFEFPVHHTRMYLVGSRETRRERRQTQGEHASYAQKGSRPGIEPTASVLWGDRADCCTTMSSKINTCWLCWKFPLEADTRSTSSIKTSHWWFHFLFRSFISCLDPPRWFHGWCHPMSIGVTAGKSHLKNLPHLHQAPLASDHLWPDPSQDQELVIAQSINGSISTIASVSLYSFIHLIIVDWLFWSYHWFWSIFPLSAHPGTQSRMLGLMLKLLCAFLTVLDFMRHPSKE